MDLLKKLRLGLKIEKKGGTLDKISEDFIPPPLPYDVQAKISERIRATEEWLADRASKGLPTEYRYEAPGYKPEKRD